MRVEPCVTFTEALHIGTIFGVRCCGAWRVAPQRSVYTAACQAGAHIGEASQSHITDLNTPRATTVEHM